MVYNNNSIGNIEMTMDIHLGASVRYDMMVGCAGSESARNVATRLDRSGIMARLGLLLLLLLLHFLLFLIHLIARSFTH